MLQPHNIFFWISGLALGLMVCAYFSCPIWEVAMPTMLLISVIAGVIGFKKKKELEGSWYMPVLGVAYNYDFLS